VCVFVFLRFAGFLIVILSLVLKEKTHRLTSNSKATPNRMQRKKLRWCIYVLGKDSLVYLHRLTSYPDPPRATNSFPSNKS
jgi:hypothetical protein